MIEIGSFNWQFLEREKVLLGVTGKDFFFYLNRVSIFKLEIMTLDNDLCELSLLFGKNTKGFINRAVMFFGAEEYILDHLVESILLEGHPCV